MSGENYIKKWSHGGHVDLQRYKKHGSGMFLFRAYLNRRAADAQTLKSRRAKVIGNVAGWRPTDGYTWALGELLMLEILDELDPIIRDLLKFSEQTDIEDCDPPRRKLRKLRTVLRINPGHGRLDVERIMNKTHAIYFWYRAYFAMNTDLSYRPEDAIATEVAKKLGISKTSALNYWKGAEPAALRLWGKEVSRRAKRSATVKKNATIHKRPKNRSGKRITFGNQKHANG